MIWQFPYLSGLLFISSAISIFIAFIVWRRRPARGAIYLAALMVSVAIWQFGYAFEISSEQIFTMVFWHKVQYAGNVFIPLMWLAFALDYTGKQNWLNFWNYLLIGSEPLITLIIVWTNDQHQLFWSRLEPVSRMGYTILAETAGLWASIHTIYFYLLMLVGSILLIQTMSYGWIYYRRQTVALMIGVLAPWIANLVDILTMKQKYLLELTPIALTLSGFAIAWGMYRYRLLDILPVAREAIIENMTDGMIVLDNQNRIVDMNRSAEKMLRKQASSAMGKRVDTIWSGWPSDVTLPMSRRYTGKEIEKVTQDGRHIYDLRLSALFDRRGGLTGRLAVLRDVTTQRRTENMLQRRDEILEAISFAAEQFLLEKNWQEVIPDILAQLGNATVVHRIYLDEFSLPGQPDSSGSSYAWTAERLIPDEDLTIKAPEFLGEQGWRRWREILESGQVIHGPLDELPEQERGQLAQNGIRSIVVLPIFVEEKLWGSLGLVDVQTDRFWTPIEIDALRVLSNTIGAAIEREHYEVLLQKRALIINSLLNVSEIIGSTLDTNQIIDRIVIAAQNMIPVERVAVFLWDEENAWLTPLMPGEGSETKLVISAEQSMQFSAMRLTPDSFLILHDLMERKVAIAIDDTASSSMIPPEIVNYYGICSLLAVPFMLRDKFIGVLYLDHTCHKHAFTMEEIDIANALARQAVLALERARLYAQSKEDAEELASLYRASTRLLEAGSNLESLAFQITQAVTREFASAYGSVLLLDEDREELVMIAQAGLMQLQDLPLPLDGPGISVASFKLGRAIYVPDVRQDSRYVSASEYTRSELVFPLRSGGKVMGVLNLESPEVDAFDEKDQRIVAAFAENAALALENVRLFNAARAHARHMMLLNEITRSAIESSDFQKVLESVTDRLPELINADSAYITLWDQEVERIIPGTATVDVREKYKSLTPESGEITVTQAVLQEKRPLVIEDVQESKYVSPRIAIYFPTKSLIALPLIAGEQKYGALMIAFNQVHRFTEREIGLCEQAARQVALAISKAWSLDIARRSAQEAENLRQASSALSSSLELQKVLVIILVHLEQVVNYDSACIFLLENGSLRAVAGRGFQDQNDVIGKKYPIDILTSENQDTNRPVILEDAQKDDRFQRWGGTSYVRGWMGVPLRAGGRKIGYLTLDSRKVDAFDANAANLAQAFANQAAIAIENSQLFESAKQRAREAETLRQAGAIVASTLDQDTAIQLILEQLERVVPYDSASVQLLRGNYLEIVGGRGWPAGSSVVGIRFPIPGDNPNTLVVENRQPQIFSDTRRQYIQFNQKPHDRIYSWMGIPLIVRDSVIGMLAIDSEELSYFTSDHARLATAFADQVAIVMENARLFSAEQRRVMQLDALRATAVDISAELELSRLLKTILERAVTLLDAKGGELSLFDEDHGDLIIVVSHNMGQDFAGTRLAMGEGVMGSAAEKLEPLIIHDYPPWEGCLPQYADGQWHSVMASPLMVHGRLVGVIGVVDDDPGRMFSRPDLELLNMFAYQSAIAVDNAHLFKEAKEAAERRAVLHKVSQEIVSASLVPEQVYGTIHKAVGQLMPADAFIITLLDRPYGDIQIVYLVDKRARDPSIHIPRTHSLNDQVFSTGQSIYFEDYDQVDGVFGMHVGSDKHSRSILAVPLRLGEEIIGMISAQSYQPNSYTQEDMLLLEMLATHAAIALENTRLFAEVQWLAITDPLTDLYNRRGLVELGRREIDRSRRFGRPLSAIMLDIDNFKAVNDTYGHAIGDQVLAGLANTCREIVREVDLLVRYGGEEFLILLPESELGASVQVAERLRRRIERSPFQTDPGEIHITISLGVVTFNSEVDDLEGLIDRADEALYAAKQAGRNQVFADRNRIVE
jgi:diguanylate cyclase (GGDEF)-like protein/PAS domain S-box-containing protein